MSSSSNPTPNHAPPNPEIHTGINLEIPEEPWEIYPEMAQNLHDLFGPMEGCTQVPMDEWSAVDSSTWRIDTSNLSEGQVGALVNAYVQSRVLKVLLGFREAARDVVLGLIESAMADGGETEE